VYSPYVRPEFANIAQEHTMPATLYTRRAGAGKTDIALESIRALLENDPIRQVWVLLPTELQTASFRSRLYEKLSRPVFGVEVFDFYGLYTRLLYGLAIPQRRVPDTARFRILRHVLDQTPLQYFGKIADKPGFVRVVAEFIQEMKQARVFPDDLQIVARTPKDRELAAIYAAYQKFLRDSDLVDAEGEGWLALEKVLDTPPHSMNVHLLIVDGFDQFTLVQTRLLAAMAERVGEMVVTLTYEPERAQTALRRFAQTRDRLRTFIPALREVAADKVAAPDMRPPALAHLSRMIFEGSDAPAQIDETDSVRLIEAPDPRREVEETLRRVKRLILDGTPPDRIAVIARDLRQYMPYLLELSAEYNLPVHMRGGVPLRDNPAVATLLKLIDLHTGNFRRLPVIELIASPYLSLPYLKPEDAALLDRISRKRVVTHVKELWFSAIRYSIIKQNEADPPLDDDDEPIYGLLTEEQATVLIDALDSFFTRVTPPEQATTRAYVAWLEGLIGGDPASVPEPIEDEAPIPTDILAFSVIKQIRASVRFAARDLAAMRCLRKIFRELIAGEELIAAGIANATNPGDPPEPPTWETFRRDLGVAIDNATIALYRDGARDAGRSASILISTVYEARGLTHDHVFLLGLSEGQFPAPAREDSLYHDTEREKLNLALNQIYDTEGIDYLVTRASQADEQSLFYEMTAIPLRSLTLARPWHENGSDWPASPYWKAVLRTIAVQPERFSMSKSVAPGDAARFTELVTALAQALNDPAQIADTFHILEWVMQHPDYAPRWQNALDARQVEQLRASQTEGAHMGILRHAGNLELIRQEVGAGRLWSASQLNELGLCPFQFFAKRLLDLEEMDEPEPGADTLQTGSIIHAVLQAAYAGFDAAGLTITPEDWTEAEKLFLPTITPVLESAPFRFGFRPDALWEQEKAAIIRQIGAFIENDFSKDSAIGKLLPGVRRSVFHEARFGGGGSFILQTAVGPLSVHGSIDRIDVVGDQAIVIDYKTGSAKHDVKDMVGGRDVQLLLYLAGARDVLAAYGATPVRGAFIHVKGIEQKGVVDVEKNATDIELATEKIAEMIAQARAGRFPNVPGRPENGKCTRWCKFSELCRPWS
jgi:ATP-dependent helicase/nuclease subunit B